MTAPTWQGAPALRALQQFLDEGLRLGLYSGAAAGVATSAGRAVAFAGAHAFGDNTPVGPGSLFDLASVTKTFTAAALVRLAEAGRIDLDAPVAAVLGLPQPGAAHITLRSLLTHVAGYPAESFVWREPGAPEDRLHQVLATPLESAPDETFRYSCLGYIAAGRYAERVTDVALPELLAEAITDPLHLPSIRFGPVDPVTAVATEREDYLGRGMVRGTVHDELSWYLGGAVGNAGMFGTVDDVLTFAQALVSSEVFSAEMVALMTKDDLRPSHGAPFGQALGPRIADPEFMGAVRGVGHLGFTGTMWIAIPELEAAGALLTNRVHPSRDRVDFALTQRRFSELVAALALGDFSG